MGDYNQYTLRNQILYGKCVMIYIKNGFLGIEIPRMPKFKDLTDKCQHKAKSTLFNIMTDKGYFVRW
jgi:hypothetical protein